MDGIGSASNNDARLVAPAGIVHRHLGSGAGRSTADGRIPGTPPSDHRSRDPRQHGAAKPPHRAPDTPHRRLADARPVQWRGALGEAGKAMVVGLSRKLIVPLAYQLLRCIAVHVSILVR